MTERPEAERGEAVAGASEERGRDFHRLYWQCRRGMLELDALLLGFMDRHYASLDAERRQALEKLLGFPDPLLLEYLMGRAVPFDKDVADVVARIRHAVEP